MTNQTADKIYKELKALREETNALKELFFLVAKDSEGEYRDSFVGRILKKAHSKSQHLFNNKNEFFKQIAQR